MRRLMFALGLLTLLWALSAPAAVPPRDVVTMAGAEACAVDGDSQPSGESDRQWRNAHHAIAVVTESVWKMAPVHAGLGAMPSARIFDLARSSSSPAPPLPAVPIYLRHTPLLI